MCQCSDIANLYAKGEALLACVKLAAITTLCRTVVSYCNRLLAEIKIIKVHHPISSGHFDNIIWGI